MNSTNQNLETIKQKFYSLNIENDQASEMHLTNSLNAKINELKENETELKSNNKKFRLANKALEICLGYLYTDLTELKNKNKQQRSVNEVLRNKLNTRMGGKLTSIQNIKIKMYHFINNLSF